MTDMDHAGRYPFCPKCARRMLLGLTTDSGIKFWFCPCREATPPDDRHREAMRLACYLEGE